MPTEKPPRAATHVTSGLLRDAGFVHGFSTRGGGVSPAPYASLNLGASVGDDPQHVAENLRRFGAAVGFDPQRLHQVFQAHGAAVHRVGPGDDPGQSPRVEADAVLALGAGVAVGVRVADCVPVLLGDVETGRVVAAHAGWRGVVAGVLRAAVASLDPRSPAALVASVGPCIGPCCFEVGPEVAAALAEASAPEVVTLTRSPKPHVDLRRAVHIQLQALGIQRRDDVGGCTVCERDRWFSYRRDGLHSGRMLAVIVAGEGRGKIGEGQGRGVCVQEVGDEPR